MLQGVKFSIFRKVFRIGTVRYNWPMSAHASQAFSIAHCTDSEDLSIFLLIFEWTLQQYSATAVPVMKRGCKTVSYVTLFDAMSMSCQLLLTFELCEQRELACVFVLCVC